MKTAVLLSAAASSAPVSAVVSSASSKFTQHSRKSCHGTPLKIGRNGHSYDDAASIEDCHEKCASSEECVAFDVTTAGETFELTGDSLLSHNTRKMGVPAQRCYYKGSTVAAMSLADNRDCHLEKEKAGELAMTGQTLDVKWDSFGVKDGFSCAGAAAHVGKGYEAFDEQSTIADCQSQCASHAYRCAGFSFTSTSGDSDASSRGRCVYHAKLETKNRDAGSSCHSWTRMLDTTGLALIQAKNKGTATKMGKSTPPFTASTEPQMAGCPAAPEDGTWCKSANANVAAGGHPGLLAEMKNGVTKMLEWKSYEEVNTFLDDLKAAVAAVLNDPLPTA